MTHSVCEFVFVFKPKFASLFALKLIINDLLEATKAGNKLIDDW